MSKTDKLRIACIGTRGLPSDYSGIERACTFLYKELALRGHHITVFCREGPSRTSTGSLGVEARRVPFLDLWSLGTLTHSGASIANAVFSGDFDVLHLHALAPGVFSGLCTLASIPTVSTIHGLDWKRAKWKGPASAVLKFGERSLARNATKIITVSQDLAQYFEQTYGRDVRYIPNGADSDLPDRQSGEEILSKYGLSSGKFFIYFGRLVPEKRIEDVISGFRSLMTDYKLVIAGDTSIGLKFVSRLKALADDDSRIIFTGQQSMDGITGLCNHSAAYVSASELEGLPMSLLESLVLGTPVVLSDIPPHRELAHQVPGSSLRFPVRDVVALTACLLKLTQQQAQYRNSAQSSRWKLTEKYSWSAIADQTEEVFYEASRRGYTTHAHSRSPKMFWK